MRIAGRVLIGVVVLALVGVGAFEWFFRSAVPDYTGEVSLAGLGSEVEVRTDAHGVPHIFADDEEDLFFAQGFVLARERLFQMEVTRLSGRGELSTLFGDATLGNDRFLRTLGIHALAERSYQEMSPEAQGKIDAYVRGINAYIDSAAPLPREFTLLRAQPGRWEATDSVAAGLLMAFSLSRSFEIDLVLYRILEQAGEEVADLLAPNYPEFAPTLTGGPLAQPPERAFHRFPSDPLTEDTGLAAQRHALPMDFSASNWMIFSGDMTASGAPLLAGSPDLEPTLPALFSMVRLSGGRYDVAGGALPGVPGIGPLGTNGDMAWSTVNGRWDDLDYFVERPDPEDPSRYLTEDGTRDFEVREEVIEVADGRGVRQEVLEVRSSRHGPIISDVLPMAPRNTALRWAAFDNPGRDIEGLLQMNRARDFAAFREALRLVDTINLGFGYAGADGDIGWQFTGAAPVRAKGDGSLPVPGWTGEYAWTGYLPYERFPFDLNPEAGYVASFNNDPGTADHYFTGFYLFQRAVRFEQLMEERGSAPVTLEELRGMQLDTRSPVAATWVPLVVDAVDDDALSDHVELLSDWDHEMSRERPAAPLFALFYAKMLRNTLIDRIGAPLWEDGLSQSYLYYVPDLLLTTIADDRAHPLFNDTRTDAQVEDRDDVIRRSFSEAVERLEELQGSDPDSWRWGRDHQMHFEHPMGDTIGLFNLAPIPTDGDHFTINSGFWRLAEPFRMDSGGVIRLTVDLAEVERSTIISPPGQSGHYRSPHYDDLAQLWADGGQVPLRFTTGDQIERLLLLTPG